jgi:hypothetical protein
MKPSLKIGMFSKSLLAGFLTGIIAAALNLLFSIIYRDATGFAAAEIIMPLSIFIGFPILLAMTGCAYYFLQKHSHSGTRWYIFFCLALMVALILTTIFDTKQNGGMLLSGLRGLCLGMEIITCILAAIFVPYFVRHPNIYV